MGFVCLQVAGVEHNSQINPRCNSFDDRFNLCNFVMLAVEKAKQTESLPIRVHGIESIEYGQEDWIETHLDLGWLD